MEEEGIGEGNVVYSYFLDFSPSMQGFFYEDLNVGMKYVADAFRQINAENENNKFYWCRDTIDPVNEASTFYDSMVSDEAIELLYGGMIRNGILTEDTGEGDEGEEESAGQNELEQAIENIDLSRIFTPNYMGASDSEEKHLNVVITDMNFLLNENDITRHNERISTFAAGLGQMTANANISVYAINGNYAGKGNDAFSAERGSNISATFYVIIFSNDAGGYSRYCRQFESSVSSEIIQNKFEILNRINEGMPSLKIDLNNFFSMDLVRNENLNFANGLFEGLDDNEFAMQLVTDGTSRGTLAMPVSEVNLSGYYSADTVGLDASKIDMEVELYRRIPRIMADDTYEIYEDPSLVLQESAGMYYDLLGTDVPGRWYLRVNLTLNTHPNVPETKYLQGILDKLRRKYIVMNLKFYMAEPSFSNPGWVHEARYPNMADENILNIEKIIDEIIQYKERAYVSRPKTDRYMGNAVIYILY